MSESERVVDGVGLSLSFGDVPALEGVDLAVSAGQVHGLLGANGAGKSTLLSMLFGLVVPDEGSLRLFGRTRDEAGAAWLDRVGGFVEAPASYPYLTGRQNLALLARLDGDPGSADLDDLLGVVGLTGAADRRVRGYSLGMRQRLGLAAALLRRPALLVVDEPTNGMDPAGVRDLRDVVRGLAAQGVAVLLSSHDMTQLSELCDRITILDRGRVVFSGDLELALATAPDPSWQLSTGDDLAARAVAAHRTGLRVTDRPGGGLHLVASRAHVDEYVVALGKADIAVRRLVEDVTALEALFFGVTGQTGQTGRGGQGGQEGGRAAPPVAADPRTRLVRQGR